MSKSIVADLKGSYMASCQLFEYMFFPPLEASYVGAMSTHWSQEVLKTILHELPQFDFWTARYFNTCYTASGHSRVVHAPSSPISVKRHSLPLPLRLDSLIILNIDTHAKSIEYEEDRTSNISCNRKHIYNSCILPGFILYVCIASTWRRAGTA